ATREPDPDLVERITQRAFRQGLLLLGAGKSALRLAPPLVLDAQDVDTGLAILDACLREEAGSTRAGQRPAPAHATA
ncbi:MAG TPA: hypothetical protein VFK09_06820, partial [Gemmatimonadales bacterium]|nr:hypothetical protein [Gemmatimonadales bacterium]